MPRIFIVGGPNGAGKTTSAMALLPERLGYLEFVNADAIAAGLSPFQPQLVAVQAGRLMLARIHELAERGVDFAFESTLASRSFAPFLRQCAADGYEVQLVFLWLHSPELAIERVAGRVAEGGHDIPQDVVVRRYWRGLENLFDLYMPLANKWSVYDNSEGKLSRIASGKFGKIVDMANESTWNLIRGSNP